MKQADPMSLDGIQEREMRGFEKEKAEFFEEHTGPDAPQLWTTHLEGRVVQVSTMAAMALLTVGDLTDDIEALTGEKYDPEKDYGAGPPSPSSPPKPAN